MSKAFDSGGAVTEFVLAETNLRAIEERYRALFDGSLDCVFINDFHGNFLDANQASLDLLGYHREEIPKLTFASLLTEDQLPLAFQTIEEIRATGRQKIPTEYRLRGKDGRQVHVETRSSLLYRDGKPFAIQGIARDLTARKLIEQKLRTSEAELAEAQRVAKLGNWHYDIASKKVRWSDELYRIFGIEKTPFGGTHETFLNCVHPDDRPRVLQTNADATAKGTAFQIEYRIQTAAGHLKTIREIGYAAKDAGGKVVSLFGTAQDITEQKRAEAILHENEVKFRQLAENISEVFWICSSDFNTIHYVSPAYELIWGRSPESLYANAHEWFEAILPEERQRVLTAFTELRGNQPQLSIEYRIMRPDGSVRWIHDRGFKICDGFGNIVRLTGIASDITERKKLEEELVMSERRMNSFFKGATAGLSLIDRDLRYVQINDTLAEMNGLSPQAHIGKTLRELFPQLAEVAEPLVRKVFTTGECISNVEFSAPTRNRPDVTRHWTASFFPVPGAKASCEAVGAIVVELTKQREIEKRMAEALNYSQMLLQTSPCGIITYRASGEAVSANSAIAQMIGATPEQMTCQNFRELESWKRSGLLNLAETALATGKLQSAEIHHVSTFGKDCWFACQFVPFEHRGAPHFLGLFMDISERKGTDEQLRKLSRAVEQSPVSIVITNLQGEIEYVNPKFTQTCGYSAGEVFGKNSRILRSSDMSPSTYREMWDTITGGREWRGEFQSKKRNGELFWESASISPIRDQAGTVTHFLVIKEDITEKKSLEQQFLRAQRMENLGTLASGVAHDLNNILAPILMSTDYLRAIAKSADDREVLKLLHDGACRGADIVRQLLIFGRGIEGERSELQVRTLLKETAKIMKETFPKNVTVETVFPPDLWTIRADPTQIHQVLLNLCINARDAMPWGGRLTLAAENRVLDNVVAGQIHGSTPGRNVVLSVTDTGSGIAPEILDQIFDPFFTTKKPGEGTGLGLSTVLGIVKGHGGCVQVQSREGDGTRFEIYLPALECDGSSKVCTRIHQTERAKGEFILLVDDEEAIRVAGRRMLENIGYRVITACNGVDGIVEYSKRRSDIRAVVTDMVMPVMDGAALIHVLRQISPELRIIGLSGLPAQPADSTGSRLPVDAFVSKPFEAARLTETLHGVLNADEKKFPTTCV